MHIDHLFKHPQHFATVAELIHRAFWSDKAGHSPQTMEARLRQADSDNRIPLSLVALQGGKVIATVNLVENDDEKRPQLTPWLAALLVVPEQRKKGVGTLMVRRLLEEARKLGFSSVYLGTDNPSFYEALGAETFELVGEKFCIMRFHLT